MLDKNVDCKRMLLMLLVDEEGLFVKSVINGDASNLLTVVVLQLVNVAHNLALVGTDRGQHHEVLKILVLGE